jgi:RNA polymerase sigma factor (sigma-70 family)
MRNNPRPVFSRLKRLPDNKLIFLVKRGSRLAFDVLIMRYTVWVKQKLHSIVYDKAAAGEIYSLFLIGLWKAFNKGKYVDEGAFEPWMKKVLVNFIRQVLRRKKNGIAYDEAERIFMLAEQDVAIQKYEWANDIEKLKYGLHEDYLAIFKMKAFGQLTNKEIAEIAHKSVGTVKSALHRSREHFQKQLAGAYLNPGIKKHTLVKLNTNQKEKVRRYVSANDDNDLHTWRLHGGRWVTQ